MLIEILNKSGVPVGEGERVSDDLPCRRCGYNLRELGRSSNCPECGVAVAQSIRGDWLRFADPAWLRLLTYGLLILCAGSSTSTLVRLFSNFLVGSLGSPLARVIAMVGTLLSIVGAWLVTTRDPASLREDAPISLRGIIRYALAVRLAGVVLHMAKVGGTLPATPTVLFLIVSQAVAVIAAVGIALEFEYIGRLARRVPDVGLAPRSRLLALCMGLVLLIGVAISTCAALVFRMGGSIPQRSWWRPLLVAMRVHDVLVLIVGVMALVLFLKMMLVVHRQQVVAMAGWKEPE
ncbi:MAG TPA: hypothetical protein VF669_07035 [Tepidisphaeraceae bacterium]